VIHNTSSQRGFTLIEVLVAATIIAVLTSIGVVSYQAANRRARDAKRKADLEQIRAALEMYKADSNWYPSGSWIDVSGLPITGYLSPIPSPPKTGEVYYYNAANPSDGHYYGYCLSSKMEGSITNPSSSCTYSGSGYNYGLKSP